MEKYPRDPYEYSRERARRMDERGPPPSSPSEIASSPSSTPSPVQETGNNNEEGPRKRQRQSVLTFNDGQLTTKEPLVNPVDREDPRRKALAEVAKETWSLLPGLLATRPDVGNDSYLCRKQTLDPNKCAGLAARIQVVDADTIDAALTIQKGPKPVAILNMANASHAGGGWRHGALAQEEAICYRTSLIKTLHKKHYPIPDDGVIYSPTVLVIRDSFGKGHDLLDFRNPSKLKVVSVVSAAAVCRPNLKKNANGRDTYKNASDVKLMKEKMREVLRTSIRNRHRQIVLGAFGCGAFGNPNHEVAAMWNEVFQETEFKGGYWSDVLFAVLDGQRVNNFQVFKAELDGMTV